MTREARREWYAAADAVLDGIPPHEIASLAKRAMRHADHPSKIVPAILKEGEGGYQSMATIRRPDNANVLPPRDVQADADRAEVAALMAGLAKKLSANHDA